MSALKSEIRNPKSEHTRVETESDYLFSSSWLRAGAIPLSAIYGAALTIIPRTAGDRVDARVISIGNIHVGGVGKTPLVIAVAAHLHAKGFKPAVVSRGYGGRLSAVGAVVMAGRDGTPVTMNSTAADVGDEPLEIAKSFPHVPVFIGADRLAAARKAALVARTIILDDGFTHTRLERDLDVVIVPASCDPARQHLLPWGRLREPLSELSRADALVHMRELGDDKETDHMDLWSRYTDAKHFIAQRYISGVRPYKGTVEPIALLGRKVVVFCGIANPERFEKTVEASGAKIVEVFVKRDHHVFSRKELALIAKLVSHHNAIAVTTEKDAARLDEAPLPFPIAIITTGVRAPEFLDYCCQR